MGSRIAIHANPSLAHQVAIGKALHAGFSRHGLSATLTHDPKADADVHVCAGPWFALDNWRNHDRTLYIDRAYWGDPDAVSVHWLQLGEKRFDRPPSAWRVAPDLEPYRDSDREIWLSDYRREPPDWWKGDVRKHPAEEKTDVSLFDALTPYGVAWGGKGTALVDAMVEGLIVKPIDEHSPVFPVAGEQNDAGRLRVLKTLSWHNWAITEIERGAMWERLSQ